MLKINVDSPLGLSYNVSCTIEVSLKKGGNLSPSVKQSRAEKQDVQQTRRKLYGEEVVQVLSSIKGLNGQHTRFRRFCETVQLPPEAKRNILDCSASGSCHIALIQHQDPCFHLKLKSGEQVREGIERFKQFHSQEPEEVLIVNLSHGTDSKKAPRCYLYPGKSLA